MDLVEDDERFVAGFGGQCLEHCGLCEQGVVGEGGTCPACGQRLSGTPSRGCQGHDGAAAGPGAFFSPLLRKPGCRDHDQDTVHDMFGEKTRGVFQGEACLPSARARVDEHGLPRAQGDVQGALLPATQ